MLFRVAVVAFVVAGLSFTSISLASAQGGIQSAVGWIREGSVVRLFQPSDSVGIGTPNPAEKLHVLGGVRVDGDLTCPACVHASDIADGSVTSTKIANGAVGSVQLAP